MSEKRENPFPQNVIDRIYLHTYTLTWCHILICSYSENKVEVLDSLVEQSLVQLEKHELIPDPVTSYIEQENSEEYSTVIETSKNKKITPNNRQVI